MARVYITLFAGIAVLAAAILSPVEAGPKQAIEACMQETGTSPADLDNFAKTGQFTQQLKCTLGCALKTLGFMTADGMLDIPTIKSNLPPALSDLIESCGQKANPEKDICQRAATYVQCFVASQPKFFIEFVSMN